MDPYYQDEHVTLFHGDCLELADVWTDADVLVTDPPYGYNVKMCYGDGTARGGSTVWHGTAIANDADLTCRDAALDLWGSRPALVFGSWKRPKPPATHTVLIWDKGPAHGMGDLQIPWKPNHEEIYVMGKGFVGKRTSGVLSGYTQVTWASKGLEHPNMKPLSLMHELIGKCPPGVIADPFAGSGSTLVAARNLGRRAIGVELEERYCEIIAKRLAQGALDLTF